MASNPPAGFSILSSYSKASGLDSEINLTVELYECRTLSGFSDVCVFNAVLVSSLVMSSSVMPHLWVHETVRMNDSTNNYDRR
jgi:hypothetical protein